MNGWSEIFASAATVCALIFSGIAVLRNKKQDDSGDGKLTGTILSELGAIKGGVNDVKAELKEQRELNMKLVERVTAVEESAKQAHKRIDRVEIREKGA